MRLLRQWRWGQKVNVERKIRKNMSNENCDLSIKQLNAGDVDHFWMKCKRQLQQQLSTR